ncbi:MAG TPA: UDP-N-acetylmuramoyl-L-alanyl-D-glutamate--2,6-diaminopimelate ligase [Dokdonella sp.]|uniref:UDP-N-acetylmuramoyl-L-alanyl-D-glutamate--2, 6-diaminopimelate ligase n=1 Tax=Dokdonella sp. TaxID=2291710 RepID=UPI002C723949|nr:UDP-N-acetylmuramoyl-L-alanyl-D-glutamate--2,6-diaminopimelate ligase [Dokdonella sp.]HUD43213.1 UDP-N-acetylmuramoyl-L-alanyl-D-glutamate--2,6-diaminopimelate ligase [Dokdonella sp.]
MSRAYRASLKDLLAGVVDAGDVVIGGLEQDSRRIVSGDAFVALRGTRTHGLAHAPRALERGAAAILAELPLPSDAPILPGTVPLIGIEDLRGKLGAIASRYYGEPSQALRVVGVTGTNGKTSTVQLLAQALSHLGRRAATIGTLGAGLYGALAPGEHTTPDAIAVQRLLAEFRDAGATDVAMEVSSHALAQGRVNAVAFSVAVFTNLTRDHLDYHGSMAAYGAAKAGLFRFPGLAAAVLNLDDPFGAALAVQLPESLQRVTCGLDDPRADVRAGAIAASVEGLAFELHTPWGAGPVRTRLLGAFNVANLLAVVACLGIAGVAFDEIVAALAVLEPVPGRMSRLGGHDDVPLLVVDYAHTPDALEKALTTLRAHGAGDLICVFGCGGERDAGKRPQMAAIAESLADRVVVTDDNPRGEDGDTIVADILAGFVAPGRVTVQRDRARAIAEAVRGARGGDIVLIAGKGHEPYQEVGGVRHPFDDRRVAQAALEARR